MRKEIKYVGFYDLPDSQHKRASNLAATDKMDYVCGAMERAGYAVHLISPSWFTEADSRWIGQSTVNLGKHKRLTLCPSVGTKCKWTRNAKIVLTLSWLCFYLVLHVRRREKILVYHSPWLSLPIRWAKRIKGFHLVLEVEEVYSEVWDIGAIQGNWERKLFARADSFMAVSDILAERLGPKAQVVLYGNYGLPAYHTRQSTSDEVRLVYAGSIDATKGGAVRAVECCRHLTNNYKLHLCGCGSEDKIADLQELIRDINAELGRTACVFHGLLLGEEFSEFLSSCHIALNPQLMGKYMTTAFPSKVVKYLSHNLPVVTTPIESVLKSPLASLLTFPENDTPQAIAQAIQSVDLTKPFDSRSAISQLDEQFTAQIKELME